MKLDKVVPEAAHYIMEYEKLGFGLFLHWGLYSQLESGEWIQNYGQIPKDEYAKLTKKFTAHGFDARRLISFAKECGIRYVCLTTRHHDGFSLYDTRGLNDFDAPHSGAGRDLIKEYADACHELEMPMFLYHTTLDWKVDSFQSDWDVYLEYLKASVETLCKFYGKVSGFWFDGNWAKPDSDWKEDELYGLIRKYHPECIIVNNSSTGARGRRGHQEVDVLTFEQGTPAKLETRSGEKYVAREMCETINSHWGATSKDFTYKSPAEIIDILATCRGNGANLLLNVGLSPDGSICEYEVAVMKIVGKWIQNCGYSIYEGRPTELHCKGKDFVLQLGTDYYYFLHNLPIHGNLHLLKGESGGGLKTIQGQLPEVKSICWVDNEEILSFSQDKEKGMLTFCASNYPYGENTILRVAKIQCV